MYTNLKPFSVMGLPNKIASSEKEAHATTTKRDFQSKQEALSEAGKSVVPAPPLKISLPSRGGGEEEEEEVAGGGCTTPKAAERGESDLPKCPPPPRKPKSVPSTKRKAQRVLLDLSSEIDLLFPSNILRDFMCGKIKKVRTGCPQIL